MFLKIITNEYIPTNMDTYQHKEMRSILKYFTGRDFNLEYESSHSTWDGKTFWMLFHDDTVLFVMASLPYFFVFTVLSFNKPFEELEVS